MSWKKKYAIGCLIALLVLSGIDNYYRPGHDVRVGVVLLMAAVWPITVTIAVGSAIGEMVRERAG